MHPRDALALRERDVEQARSFCARRHRTIRRSRPCGKTPAYRETPTSRRNTGASTAYVLAVGYVWYWYLYQSQMMLELAVLSRDALLRCKSALAPDWRIRRTGNVASVCRSPSIASTPARRARKASERCSTRRGRRYHNMDRLPNLRGGGKSGTERLIGVGNARSRCVERHDARSNRKIDELTASTAIVTVSRELAPATSLSEPPIALLSGRQTTTRAPRSGRSQSKPSRNKTNVLTSCSVRAPVALTAAVTVCTVPA